MLNMVCSFRGVLVKNEHRTTERKSLAICGSPRGGTSFSACAFLQVGDPTKRTRKVRISQRKEHGHLKEAFQADSHDMIRWIIGRFSSPHPVSGWKLPAIESRFSEVSAVLPTPHFVVIFKEPLSIGVRPGGRGSKNPINVLQRVVTEHQRRATIAATTEHPLLLDSYENAMMSLPFVQAAAAGFADVSSCDEAAVIAGIRADGRRCLGQRQDRWRFRP
jgi:hypothetical protein